MVCLTLNSEEKKDHHEFELWKDFPKGLKVLLFYKDADFAARTKIKLEKIHYIVSLYSNSDQALHAISAESFHVAIIELVTSDNCIWCFKFLESARSSLPIIVASSDSSLGMMMKCISLGAAEFLQKPLSEEKLSTIWQHVVHKVFNSGDECTASITKSLKPIKEMVVSMLHLKHDDNIEKGESEIHEKLATPSTPHLENKKSSFDNKEDSEERNNLRSVEKTCNDSTIMPCRVDNKTELDTNKINKCGEAEVSSEEKSDECSSAKEKNDKSAITISKKKKNAYLLNGIKGKRKKTKVDWTPELHKKFVKAVEQLGLDQAIPSKILDLMKVQGLTRHNVASHLQKYRIHKRHIICPKVEQKIWPNNPQDMINMRGFMQRPFLTNPYPPFHQYYYSNVHPRPHCAPWVPPFQPWHHVPPLQDNWHCQFHNSLVQADTWGCPVFPPNYGLQYAFPPRSPAMCHVYGVEHLNSSKTFCLDEEVIDKVVKEALAEPLGPLPIGLTPPSTVTVLSELHRLGIHTVPFLPPPLP